MSVPKVKRIPFTLYLTNYNIYQKTDFERQKNTFYPDKVSVIIGSELLSANNYDMVFVKFKKYQRKKSNFIESDVAFADVDNTHSDNEAEWITIKKCQEIFKSIEAYYFTSRNHMKEKNGKKPRPKFHVVFPLGQVVQDRTEYENVLKKLTSEYYFFDKCNDCSRFFFGNSNTEISYNRGNSILTIFENIEKYKTFEKLTDLSWNDVRKDNLSEHGFSSRNEYLFKYVCSIRKDFSKEDVKKKAYEENSKFEIPLNDEEVENILNSAYKTDYTRPALLTIENEGKLLVDKYKNRLLFDFVEKRWYYYNKKWWGLDKTGIVKRCVSSLVEDRYKQLEVAKTKEWKKTLKSWIKKISTPTQKDAIAKEAATLLPVEYLPNSENIFDKQLHLLNLWNGTFNLKTKKLQKHSYKDYMHNIIHISYDEKAECPLFDSFLKEVFCDNQEVINLVLKIFGLCLVGDNKEDLFFIFVGKGCNGKTTLLSVMSKLFGPDYSGDLPASTLYSRQDFDLSSYLAMLKGKRLVTVSEYGEGKVINEGKLKALSGGNPITARAKYEKAITFTPQFKLIFDTNFLPTVKNNLGFWRRVIVIPFTRDFTNSVDVRLEEKLCNELPGIFNKVIEGLKLYEKESIGNLPKIIKEANTAYRESQDILQDFIEDVAVLGEQFIISSSELFSEWRLFCNDRNEKAGSMKNFLSSIFRQYKITKYRPGTGDRKRHLKGIGLRRDRKEEM